MHNYRKHSFFNPPFPKSAPYIGPTTNISPKFEPIPDSSKLELSEKDTSNAQKDEALFEIFGLKIFFDDLLIICVLLFLYQEGIQDEYLLISLILLLLS